MRVKDIKALLLKCYLNKAMFKYIVEHSYYHELQDKNQRSLFFGHAKTFACINFPTCRNIAAFSVIYKCKIFKYYLIIKYIYLIIINI